MEESKRYQLVWKTAVPLIHPWFCGRFRFTPEVYDRQKPALIIANHVTNYDPFFVALSFPKHQLYFVASEHLMRMGWLSRVICYLAGIIARRKGTTGMDAAMASLRKLRAGHSVCIFGEGETTWDGVSQPIFSSTGMLAKISGADLITYRIEGGYLSAPRWGKGIRRGKMRGHIVRTYTPDELKTMAPEEITAAIDRDIHENTWQRQQQERIAYKGRQRARFIETALFMCPQCRQIGTVYGDGDHVRCSCGLDAEYTEHGFFAPAKPFETMAEWDAWQLEQLQALDASTVETLFSDGDVRLVRLENDHSQQLVSEGTLSIQGGALCIGESRFPLNEVSDMALVQRRLLVFTHNTQYYEARSAKPICLRKYLHIWKNIEHTGV